MGSVRVTAVAALFASWAAVAGCSGAGPSVAPAPSATVVKPAPLPGAEWGSVRWAAFESKAQGLSMPLPPDPGWKVEDGKDAWFVAWHAATRTQVAARMIATDGLANRARCEAHARELRDLPAREGASVIERRRVDLPSGFDTIVEVGVLAGAPGQPITGYVLAFGGWAKRCFAYALTTSAEGRGAEEAVADRLALFMERSFLRMKFLGSLTGVPREKPPFGPERPR